MHEVHASTVRDRCALRLVTALVGLCVLVAGCAGGGDEGAEVDPTAAEQPRDQPAGECVPPELDVPETRRVSDGSPADLELVSFDGTAIRLHWFPHPDADDTAPAPTVLMGPGWGLAGDTDVDTVGVLGTLNIAELRDAGYNVLTWDPRGFGRSGGTATVNSADHEGRDVQHLIEWVASQPQALLDGPRDPSLGMVGASYGGGIQLVTAAIDCRVDAIVPTTAWHSLESSLYRSGIAKAGWAGRLTEVSAIASVDPVVASANESAQLTGRMADDDLEWFRDRGPGELVAGITAPTLLIQGTVDTLFTLDEALTNLALLEAGDQPVSMLWYCGGHGLCLTDTGDRDRTRRAAIAWLDRHVKGDQVDTGPRIDLVDQLGRRWTGEHFPDPSTHVTANGSGTLELREGGGSGPVVPPEGFDDPLLGIARAITPAPADHAVEVTASVPAGSLVLGAPRLTLTYRGTVAEGESPTRVFAQLVDPDGVVVGNQITPVPLELDGEEHRVTVPLEVVVFAAERDIELTLQVVATTVAYAAPRLGGSVELGSIDVELPVVDDLELSGPSSSRAGSP